MTELTSSEGTGAPQLETGTTTVGLVAADGVVLATDRRASLGGRFVANKNVAKIEQVHPTAALTIAGSVGSAQAFVRRLRAETNLYESRRDGDMSMEALATYASNLIRGMRVHPLLGGVDETGGHLYEIDPAGGLMEDAYGATGSGMQLAYGVLEREFGEDLTVAEAESAAVAAVDAATERDTASGNGVSVARIATDGVEITEGADGVEITEETE